MKVYTLLRLLTLLALLVFYIQPVRAGDVADCFKTQEMSECNRQALGHVEFKSVVLQFVDPGGTQLGEGLARLFWREILASISNVADAGVILAYDRQEQISSSLGDQDVQYFLHNKYHAAALKIAQFQETQMAVWGAVINDGDGIYLQNYLTLNEVNEPSEAPWTNMQVAFSSGQTLSIPFMRKQFNLPEVAGTRTELFAQTFYTRCGLSAGCPKGIVLKTNPNDNSDVAYYANEGVAVSIVDMDHKWLHVKDANGESAWINIYHLEMYPKNVLFDDVTKVNLRSNPNDTVLESVNLNGQFDVLDVRKSRNYPWYKIDVKGTKGWVRSDIATNRSYFFPAVHLIAGFYRYYKLQYSRAIVEFNEYLTFVPEEDNVTRASIYKLLAASEFARNNKASANNYMDQAINYTPYDASVYSQKASINIVNEDQFIAAMKLLEDAYQLNPKDSGLNAITSFLVKMDNENVLPKLVGHNDLNDIRSRLSALQAR